MKFRKKRFHFPFQGVNYTPCKGMWNHPTSQHETVYFIINFNASSTKINLVWIQICIKLE